MIVILIKKKINKYMNAYIFINNKFTIQEIDSSNYQFKQYIINVIFNTINKIYKVKYGENLFTRNASFMSLRNSDTRWYLLVGFFDFLLFLSPLELESELEPEPSRT